MDPVVASLAGRLATTVLTFAAPRIRDRLVGTQEERELEAAYRAAFGAMLAEIPDAADRARMDAIEPQLVTLFSDPQVATVLLDVALRRQQPPVEPLIERLWVAGFDPETFPLPLEHSLRVLTVRLAEELRKRASRDRSPIFNQVALAELERLRVSVAQLADDRLTTVESDLFGGIPAAPSLVVGRDGVLEDIRGELLAERTMRFVRVIRGWPGVGKSTIAAALAHDPDVRLRYPEALWASLTDSTRARDQLLAWSAVLGIGEPRIGGDVDEISAQLAHAAADRALLLIVDDVWRLEDGQPFMIGGAASATLVTTRLPEVANALAGAKTEIVRLDPLAHEDAVSLIAALAPSVAAEHPEECDQLVEELETLPLALQVAGRLLRSEAALGWGVTELLADLRTGSALLEAQAPADRADIVNQTTPTVAALLRESTDRLASADRERFALLGAFAPKPATFALDAIRAVWDTADPRPGVRTLVSRGLLEPLGDLRFQMHALLAVHARSLLE